MTSVNETPPRNAESYSLHRYGDGSDGVVPYGTYDTEVKSADLGQRHSRKMGRAVYVLIGLIIGVIIGYCLHDTLNSSTHEISRRIWTREETRRHTIQKWAAEHKAHGDVVLERRRVWEMERLEHEKRLERARQALAWEGPWPAERCSGYRTREYSARLIKVGLGLNPIKECHRKPLKIHGRAVLPSRCENHAVSGQVTGHWTVFNESACATFWGFVIEIVTPVLVLTFVHVYFWRFKF